MSEFISLDASAIEGLFADRQAAASQYPEFFVPKELVADFLKAWFNAIKEDFKQEGIEDLGTKTLSDMQKLRNLYPDFDSYMDVNAASLGYNGQVRVPGLHFTWQDQVLKATKPE